MSAPPLASTAAPAGRHPEPSFWLALRGVCLLAWRAQWTWKRLPLRLISAFVLPLLAYLVIPSPQQWQERHSILGNPMDCVNPYIARLDRAKIPIEKESRDKLRNIFQEEYARAEGQILNLRVETQPVEKPAPVTKEAKRTEAINACFDRIQSRAKEFLGEQQFKRLQEATNRAGDRARQRAQEKTGDWTEPFYRLLLDFYFFIVLPLECIRQCGGLIREEAQAGTLSFLATRPLSRAKLLAAKYLAQVGWLQASLLGQTLLLFFVGWLRNVPSLGALLPLFLGAQVLAVFAWSALGIFLGQATNRYMAMALVYGTVVELGIGRIPTNINALSIMRHLKTLLANSAELQALYDWPATGVAFSLFALVVGAGLFLSLAATLYSWLEYHHVSEMQK